MSTPIPDELIQELERIAAQENRTPAELLASLLAEHKSESIWIPAQVLLQNALEASIASPMPVDTAANSREILEQEYADYLKKRLDTNDDSD
jgi:hypothetical protein